MDNKLGDQSTGFMLRQSGTWAALYGYLIYYSTAQNKVYLYNYSNGTKSAILAQAAATLTGGNSYTLTASISGSSPVVITVSLGGTQLFSYSDSAGTKVTAAGNFAIYEFSSQTDNGGTLGQGWDSIQVADAVSESFTVSPSVIPNGHSGNITLTLTGTGTSWTSGTPGSPTFTVSSVANVTKVSQSVASSTSATVVVTTGAGTGTLTVSDTIATNTTTVSVPTLSISPTSGAPNTSETVTATGTNTVWSQETAGSLFSAAAVTGASIASTSVASNTSATFTLTNSTGGNTGTVTITDNSTTKTASFTTTNGTIALTAPVAYQLFQRQGGRADIVITGTYTGNPAAIEANWSGNGLSYTTIVSSPSGGSFSGKLANQPTGFGTLTVRFTSNTSVNASATNVCVGDCYVIAGQSNASGRGTNNQNYTSPRGIPAVMFGNDYTWKALADPTDSTTSQVDSVSATNDSGAHGSIWPLVANALVNATGVPVAFIPCASGGTQINVSSPGGWLPGTNHFDRTTLYGSMAYRAANCGSNGVRAVLWLQGESDLSMTQAQYNTALNALAANVQADLRVPLMPAILFNTISPAASATNVQAGQRQSIQQTAYVAAGPDLTSVTSDDVSGGLHLYGDSVLQAAAALWASAMQAAFYSSTATSGYSRGRLVNGG